MLFVDLGNGPEDSEFEQFKDQFDVKSLFYVLTHV